MTQWVPDLRSDHTELIPDHLPSPEVGGLPETTGPVLTETEREPHDSGV